MIKEHVNRIPVHMDGKTIYDIVLEDSFDSLAKEISVLGTEKKKICIIADSNVADIYLDEVTRILFGCCREVTSYVFPAGEENKNLKTVQGAYEHLILNHYDRKDLLVALGGGVTGDLCGFVAATYLRGVDFVQIPTTLLSQVDSGIGGKTGVDFDSYKNMVGAFHMPKLVYTNVSVLRTLPDNQFSGGMGEVIKHGLIRDREYFDWIAANKEKILAKDADTLKLLIQGSDFIKREVVEIMNICKERGLVNQDEINAYRALMEYFSIPTSVSGLDPEEVIAATKNDKKMEAGVIKFILLDRVGHAYIDRTVTKEEMERALAAIFR